MTANRPPCSVVLEGGVTSAVLYATLLARLADSYTFKQLGGTSSGAVAATAAAAAEFARRWGRNPARAPFEALSAFPMLLAETDGAGRTTLLRLFQPAPRARAGFAIAMAALDRSGDDGVLATVTRCLRALLMQFPLAGGLLGGLMVAGVALAATHLTPSGGGGLVTAVIGALLLVLTVLGALTGLVGWALWCTARALRDNHWGLCDGLSQAAGDQPALTSALHGLFQNLAGRQAGEAPLTFGDLWWGPRDAQGRRPESGARGIDLQVITSAVTLARPVRLPGDPGVHPLREFFYDPQEWNRLFPPDVMRHLETHARPVSCTAADGRTLRALPEPEHWPVLLTARLSLSFPLLLSAVPMYVAVAQVADPSTQPMFDARRIYFSDGGITSNCPIQLFDAPLPRFPTFGVNLYRGPRGSRPSATRSDTQDPELADALRPDPTRWTTPLPFLLSILTTALNWRDSLQRRLPGYRERMVHVSLPPEVGGLHLAMQPRTIEALAQLGVEAADTLTDAFLVSGAADHAAAWDRHRWTRARSTLTAMRRYLATFAGLLDAGSPPYERLLGTATPAEHPFDGDTARAQALLLAQGVRDLVDTLDAHTPAAKAPDAPMDRNAPQPQPALRLSPPW